MQRDISRVVGHGFPPYLNPAVENTTCTLRIDTDGDEFSDLAHKTMAVISVVISYVYMHTYKSLIRAEKRYLYQTLASDTLDQSVSEYFIFKYMDFIARLITQAVGLHENHEYTLALLFTSRIWLK